MSVVQVRAVRTLARCFLPGLAPSCSQQTFGTSHPLVAWELSHELLPDQPQRPGRRDCQHDRPCSENHAMPAPWILLDRKDRMWQRASHLPPHDLIGRPRQHARSASHPITGVRKQGSGKESRHLQKRARNVDSTETDAHSSRMPGRCENPLSGGLDQERAIHAWTERRAPK